MENGLRLTRRAILAGGAMAGVSGLFNRVVYATASQPQTKVTFEIPPGATDCAVHVYEPKRFPYWEGRSYTPEPATLAELRQILQTLKLERVVVVQATSYGTDNTCVVASIRELGNRARGVAIIDEKTPEASLDEMHRAGVRSVRLTLNNLATTDLAAARQRLKMTIDRLRTRKNWSLQLSTNAATYEILREELMAMPMLLVVDHFGQVQVSEGIGQRGFPVILELLKSGKAYVKISNPTSISRQPDLSDVTPFARALISANPQRVVWGTAWPHPTAGSARKPTDLSPHQQVDDGRAMNMLPVWAPDAATRKLILVDNPARLYGFGS
jgi:predicted TIM-barrel fold metal-dependent hydrolase